MHFYTGSLKKTMEQYRKRCPIGIYLPGISGSCIFLTKIEEGGVFLNQEYQTFTEQWMQNCEYLDRNQKSMVAFFEIKISDGKFTIACNEIKHEYFNYKEELEKPANYIAKGAYIISYNSICSLDDVKEDDIEKEKEFRKTTFATNFPEYLKCLFASGRDAFINTVYSHAGMLEASYQMRHLYFDGENWRNFKGEKLVDGIWNDKNGRRYSDQTSDLVARMTA